MNKIIIINQSTGYLTIDTANAYATKYDEVVLIAGSVADSECKLNENIKVHRICAYNKSSAIKRLATWLFSTIQILLLLLFKYQEHEIVYVTNPPMSYFCSSLIRRSFSIIIYDTYPNALCNIGIKQGHFIYELWSKLNRKLFKKAKNIFTLSDGMAMQLTKYVERNKIKVVPLWPSSENFKPIDKTQNDFVKSNGLENKFVVMYSGNMGYTHNIDVLIDVASKLNHENNIHFLFVGDGKKKEKMINDVKCKNLNNCTFMDYQPFEILPYSLAAADIAVVSLNEETALTSVPSKTFNLIAVGAPLLCIAPNDSEISYMVNKYKNGIVCNAVDINEITSFILKLYRNADIKNNMSANSLKASKDFTKDNAMMYI